MYAEMGKSRDSVTRQASALSLLDNHRSAPNLRACKLTQELNTWLFKYEITVVANIESA